MEGSGSTCKIQSVLHYTVDIDLPVHILGGKNSGTQDTSGFTRRRAKNISPAVSDIYLVRCTYVQWWLGGRCPLGSLPLSPRVPPNAADKSLIANSVNNSHQLAFSRV